MQNMYQPLKFMHNLTNVIKANAKKKEAICGNISPMKNTVKQ